MQARIEVTSSHGSFTFDRDTGRVTDTACLKTGPDNFGAAPVMVNIVELEIYWANRAFLYGSPDIPDSLDVLGVGFIDSTGEYCAPEKDWRRERDLQRFEGCLEELSCEMAGLYYDNKSLSSMADAMQRQLNIIKEPI